MNSTTMFLKHHLHVLQKASSMGCASLPNKLSNEAFPVCSWKLYSSCSRSHIITGRDRGILQTLGTHDRPVSNTFWRSSGFNFETFKIIKCLRKICINSCETSSVRPGAGLYGVDRVPEKPYNGTRKKTGQRSLVTMTGKGPGLIVFDLDCTLWPHHVDTTVNPPFIQNNSKVVDQDGVNITYYPDVPKVLEYLQSEGYLMGAASRTTKPPAAEQLLNFFDWNKYFKYKEIYPGSKVTHFAKFVERTNIPHHEMLFFDDEHRNIIDMEKEGVKCVFVKNGVDLQLVKDSIEKFKNGSI